MRQLLAVFAVGLSLLSPAVSALPTAKLTLHVIDEEGRPVSGADVGMGFIRAAPDGPGTVDGEPARGVTDADGYFTGSGDTGKRVTYGVVKEGYYHSRYKFTKFTDITGLIGFQRWQPWNPTLEVVLKKIKAPTSLYAKRTDRMDVPVLDQFIGYDLVKGDWVIPHGRGTSSDFLFKLEKEYQGRRDFSASLSLHFSNPGDGILSVYQPPMQGSELRLPHEAPLSDYEGKLEQSLYSKSTEILKPFYRDDQNYFFRVRTELDEEGKVINALYGKIHGNIEYWDFDEEVGTVSFTYYLNPSNNDRNLEFDPKRNLFKGIRHPHDVVNP
ncbi:hypothetical protein ACFL2V_00410 [Pseudomonadota bacterium]